MTRLVAFPIVLFYCSYTAVSQTCDNSAPNSCNFTNSFDCRWKKNNSVTYDQDRTDSNDTDGSLALAKNAAVWSITACPRPGSVHCLKFWCKFDGNGILQVTVRYVEGSSEVVLEVHNKHGGNTVWKMKQKTLKVQDENFEIHFKATGGQLKKVLLDDIRYTRSDCNLSPGVSFPDAGGVAAAIICVLLVLIVAAIIIIFFLFRRGRLQFLKNFTCFPFINDRLDSCCSKSDHPKPEHQEQSSTSHPEHKGFTRSMISQPLDLQDSTNPTEDLYSIIKDGDESADTSRSGHHNHAFQNDQTGRSIYHEPNQNPKTRLEVPSPAGASSLTSSQTAEGEYSVIRDSAIGVPSPGGIYHHPQSGDQSYPTTARGHTGTKGSKGSAATGITGSVGVYHEGPGTVPNTGSVGVYHEGSGTVPKPTGGATGVYHILDPEADASVSGQSRSVYHMASVSGNNAQTSNSHTDDYNSLDFEGKESMKKKTETGEEGKVYSHLNEGDDDAYNEMHRVQKKEVIDGDYSHIH